MKKTTLFICLAFLGLPSVVFAADINFLLEFWQVFAGVATGLVIALLLVAAVSISAAMLLGGLNILSRRK